MGMGMGITGLVGGGVALDGAVCHMLLPHTCCNRHTLRNLIKLCS